MIVVRVWNSSVGGWRCDVWFQNRRAKWKKRKKSNVFSRAGGGLLPSHSLPHFGAMSDSLCPTSMFGSPESRWPAVSSMTSGMSQLQLSQSGVPMSGFGQSLGQLNQGGSLSGGLNAGLNIATSMASNGSTVYQAHYGINTLDPVFYGHDTSGGGIGVGSESLN